tara:strand:- start:38257 stop:40326 length:2070 start_codon:yes stop_codon:yes gene_type:complete
MVNDFNNIENDDLFDESESMLVSKTDTRSYHRVYLSAQYAVDLIAMGTPDALIRGEKVLEALLCCQELDKNNKHYGNFFWEKEEGIVEDLNAVEFVLIRLIPMILEYGDRLSLGTKQKLITSVELALYEIEKINVSLVYTNIVAQDIVNSILGGQLIGSDYFVNRGINKLKEWQKHIDKSGIPNEYNSPSYSSVTINALSNLLNFSEDKESKMIAKLIILRIGISFALHLHPKTKRLAGPHSRAYYPYLSFQNSIERMAPPEINVLEDHISKNHLPNWIMKLISNRSEEINIRETSDRNKNASIGTFHSKSFSIGVTTRELDTQSNRYISNQSNVFSVQYTQGKDSIPGIVFSKYLTNNKWLGDYRTTISRGNKDIFFDEGSFRGIQNGKRSINIYTPKNLGAWDRCFSAKACIIWNSNIDKIWINQTEVKDLPTDVMSTDVIVVSCGDIYVGIRPLSLTDLGSNAPIRLVEREEQLVIELYNYLGPTKTFWELANPGAFYQGRPRSGFYAEVAEKTDFVSGAEFSSEILKGKLIEKFDPPVTFNGENNNIWSVEYTRGNESIGIELDMMEFEIEKIWIKDKDVDLYPMLDSSIATQKLKGDILLNNSKLSCQGSGARWLISIPESNLFVAAYNGPYPSSLSLRTPDGKVEIEQLNRGFVKWENGEVEIEATGLVNTPKVFGAKITKIN